MNSSGTRKPEEADTIASLSSAPGLGAVSLIRVSGPGAWAVGRALAQQPEKYECLSVRKTSVLGLVHPRTGNVLDKAVIVKYKAPESFTGEDIIEIQCHGGMGVQSAVLDALKAAGARQALAGEFTRRAFLNGKLDLAQAEALDDLINSRGEAARQIALAGLSGVLGKQIGRLRDSLTEIRSELEYDIDFPEEEAQTNLSESMDDKLKEIKATIKGILEGADRGILISRGALVVIAGAPNAGKSSLFNALAGQERSIVTPSAGTTRDAVEVETLLDGVLFRLVDTAGLHKGRGAAEKAGVEYSRRYLERADLVVFLHEANKKIKTVDENFLGKRNPNRVVRVLSKSDILENVTGKPEGFLPVSAKMGTGLAELKTELVNRVLSDGQAGATDSVGSLITRTRQRELLAGALVRLENMKIERSSEFLSADLQAASEMLDEITGRVTDEEVLDRIFNRFCIGK